MGGGLLTAGALPESLLQRFRVPYMHGVSRLTLALTCYFAIHPRTHLGRSGVTLPQLNCSLIATELRNEEERKA